MEGDSQKIRPQNFGPQRIGRAAGADIVPELSSERRRRLLF
jgi:hypothetical protein